MTGRERRQCGVKGERRTPYKSCTPGRAGTRQAVMRRRSRTVVPRARGISAVQARCIALGLWRTGEDRAAPHAHTWSLRPEYCLCSSETRSIAPGRPPSQSTHCWARVGADGLAAQRPAEPCSQSRVALCEWLPLCIVQPPLRSLSELCGAIAPSNLWRTACGRAPIECECPCGQCAQCGLSIDRLQHGAKVLEALAWPLRPQRDMLANKSFTEPFSTVRTGHEAPPCASPTARYSL